MATEWLHKIQQGDHRSIARAISMVENEATGSQALLSSLPAHTTSKIVGITGAPGAGKSTLVDALIANWVKAGKNIAVLCVDPSSPFHLGALLGDRIRMSEWYNHPQVFIRSLATRGSLGGLHPRILDITSILAAAPFDYIVVETVGVGQSEIEIAGLADVTVVVVVPEAGDEVQTMKAGIMEIANIFVVNKSDRPEADHFVKHLRMMLAPAFQTTKYEIPILKTVASKQTGITELVKAIEIHLDRQELPERRLWLLTQRAWQLIQAKRMKSLDKTELQNKIAGQLQEGSFNLYAFIQAY